MSNLISFLLVIFTSCYVVMYLSFNMSPAIFTALIVLICFISYNFWISYKERSNVHVFVSLGLVKTSPPLVLSLSIQSVSVKFEVDTGAGATIMSIAQFSSLFPNVSLQSSRVTLHSVNGSITNAGEVTLPVKYANVSSDLTLIVCSNTSDFLPLLGRNWLDVLIPQWRISFIQAHMCEVKHLSPVDATPPSLDQLAKLFPRVFDQNADSVIQGYVAKLLLKPNSLPVFAKAYSLAFGLVDPVNKHLDKMVTDGKAVRVRQAEWASPGVVVQKKDGNIRYCADFKRTLNPCLRVDYYPLPRPDDVFANLSDGTVFVSLDLTDAYTQLALDKDSQDLCILNTHRGLYKLTRLIYGVASAAAIFQSVMDRILVNIPGVICYLDNILIKGSSMSECVSRTMLVLARLNEHNVRLKLSKCDWFVEELEFLGFIISKGCRKPNPTLVSAIVDFPVPKDTKQIRSFLGMINFYAEFLPAFSTVANPLRKVNEDNFVWSPDCQQAFNNCKDLLISNQCLVHFDPNLPIVVCTDASPVGVGAVLNHVFMINGKKVEKPVMYASCTLSSAQRNYAQIDREALAIIFAITKFHKFLWGREFTLVTDNSPIQRIFSPDKGLPVRTGHRLQHWATILQGYQYKLIHRKAQFMCVPDALSRLPTKVYINDVSVCVFPSDLPVTAEIIALETAKDIVLSKVAHITQVGWPRSNHFKDDPSIVPFLKVKDSLSINSKCVMFGNRVVIPVTLRSKILQLLHAGHPGVVRTKLLARSVVWWPQLGVDIENLCNMCPSCAKVNFKASPEIVPWPPAKYPFDRVHIDFFYVKSLKMEFLVFCDAFSHWVHIQLMDGTTAPEVSVVLMQIFSMWGCLPTTLVSDNGPPFDSAEFLSFLSQLGVTSKRIPPYHPESNSLGERGVQIAKKGLEKMFEIDPVTNTVIIPLTKVAVNLKIQHFLLNHHNTPCTVTLKSPNEMLLCFKPRTLLTLLNPSIRPDASLPNTLAHFREGDRVNVKLSPKVAPVPGTVIKQIGPNRYIVSMGGVLRHTHLNQMARAP